MPYPALYTAQSVERFTAGSHGITGESTPLCGGAVPVWSMGQLPVMRRLFRSRICRRQVVQALNLALGNRENMMATLRENVEAVIRQEDETSPEGIEAKLLELQKELLRLANGKKDYNSVADEIDRLRELKQNVLVESAEREGLKQRIREMREFLEQQSAEITEYDELLVRRLIEKVTVYDE